MQSEKANDADAQSLHEEVAHLEGSNSSEGEMDVATPDPPEEPGHRLSLEETRPIKLEGTGTPPEAQESSAVQMAELQEENLNLHEALRDWEVRCLAAEQSASRRAAQVEELQTRLMSMEEEASVARSAATESLRLTDENTLLGNQLKQMEINLKDLISTQGLGHTNVKQPIQYHLRLKNKLEELRSECVSLLKERFQLEQCIRFLAANAKTIVYTPLDEGNSKTPTPRGANFQPKSLRSNHLYATPSGRASMLKFGRGVAAVAAKNSTPTKEELVDAIQQAAAKTASSFQELASDVELQAETASTPVRRHQTKNGHAEEMQSFSSSDRTPSEDGERNSIFSSRASEGLPGQSEVERRIIAKIIDICSPGKTGGTSKLLQRAQADVMGGSSAGKVHALPRVKKERSLSISSAPGKTNGRVIWR